MFFSPFISFPKGIMRDTAGYAVMLKWTMSNIYGLSPGEVRQRSTLVLVWAMSENKACSQREESFYSGSVNCLFFNFPFIHHLCHGSLYPKHLKLQRDVNRILSTYDETLLVLCCLTKKNISHSVCVCLYLLQVWWAASDLGWVVGHSYICYGPLLHGNSTILYEVRPQKGFLSNTNYSRRCNKSRGLSDLLSVCVSAAF